MTNYNDKALSEIANGGGIVGKTLQLDDGYAVINGEKYRCTDIEYKYGDLENVGKVLGIGAGDKEYIFIKKKGLGGMFGPSADIKNFLEHIDEHIEIAKEEIAEEKHIARLEAWMDEFKNDTYTLSTNAPEGYLLKKGEEIAIWSDDVEFHQIKTKRIVGASGTSIRIAKGVSWRLGGAAPIERECLVHMDTGRLVLTNQKLSFMGANKSVNMSVNKIVDVTVYANAFEVSKDGVMKKYVFMTEHGNLWAEAIKAMNRRLNQ